MTDDQPHRRVYARGYYDGLRAAGMTGGGSMDDITNWKAA
jgi:hypothetical protein